MLLMEQFEKQNLIENLAKYEVLYQISLGKILHFAKIEIESSKISFEVDLQLALGSIYELINDIKDIEFASKIFQEELEKQIAIDALHYFVNENYEQVKSGQLEVESLLNEINDNKFIDEKMKEIFNMNISSSREKYIQIISDELCKNIHESLIELQNNK